MGSYLYNFPSCSIFYFKASIFPFRFFWYISSYIHLTSIQFNGILLLFAYKTHQLNHFLAQLCSRSTSLDLALIKKYSGELAYSKTKIYAWLKIELNYNLLYALFQLTWPANPTYLQL